MMNKGLFGRRPAFQTPGFGDGLPGMPERLPDMQNIPTTAGGMFGDPMGQPQQRPGLGTRLLGQGWEGKVAALGSALMGDRNAVPQFLQNRDLMAYGEQQARAQRQASLDDYTAKKEIDQRFAPAPEAPKPRFEQDNAGNVWALDPMTGQKLSDRPAFVDPNPRTIFQNGAMVTIPNVFAQQSDGPTRPVGKLTPIPNAQTAPAQQIAGPRVISKAQYDAQLRQFGGDQLSMNAWMRNNNVIAD